MYLWLPLSAGMTATARRDVLVVTAALPMPLVVLLSGSDPQLRWGAPSPFLQFRQPCRWRRVTAGSGSVRAGRSSHP